MPKSNRPRKPQGPRSWEREERKMRSNAVIDGETVPKSKEMIRVHKPAMAPPKKPSLLWRNKGKFTLGTGAVLGTGSAAYAYTHRQKEPVLKRADWRNISEHQAQQKKATKDHVRGAGYQSLGTLGVIGGYSTGRPGKGFRDISQATKANRTIPDLFGRDGRPVQVRPNLGQRVAQGAKMLKQRPAAAVVAGGGALASYGTIKRGAARSKHEYHTKQITQIRRARDKTVAKYFDPFSGDTYEFAKKDSDTPSTGRRLAGQFAGWHGAVAGRKGKKLAATGNEVGGALLGVAPGAALTSFGARRGNLKMMAAGQGAALVGGAVGRDRAVFRNQRKGNYKPLAKSATLVLKSASQAFVNQPVTRVTALVATGGHVSRANNLQHFRGKNTSPKSHSPLMRYTK